MRRQAEAVARRLRAEVDLDLVVVVVTVALVVPVDLLVVAVTSTAVALVVPVARVDLAGPVTVGLVARVDLAGPVTVGLVAPAVLVGLVTVGLVAPAVLVGLVTSTEAVPVAPVATTSVRGHPTPSAASVVNRGAMEQRHGAGDLRREPAGAAHFLRPEGFGTKDRSTTLATTSSRYGIRAKTAGASTSSESGSRCN
jgi:hypothetical protein